MVRVRNAMDIFYTYYLIGQSTQKCFETEAGYVYVVELRWIPLIYLSQAGQMLKRTVALKGKDSTPYIHVVECLAL